MKGVTINFEIGKIYTPKMYAEGVFYKCDEGKVYHSEDLKTWHPTQNSLSWFIDTDFEEYNIPINWREVPRYKEVEVRDEDGEMWKKAYFIYCEESNVFSPRYTLPFAVVSEIGGEIEFYGQCRLIEK